MSETSAPPVSIVEFLTARLDEETARLDALAEAEAESCRNDGMPDTTAQEIMDYWLRIDPETGQPVTEWPKHLADIAAKRAIIHQHGDDYHECPEGFMDSAETEPHIGWERECPTLRWLASPDSDHPDYRQEWKP